MKDICQNVRWHVGHDCYFNFFLYVLVIRSSLPTRHSYYFKIAEEGKYSSFYNTVVNANVIATLVWGL